MKQRVERYKDEEDEEEVSEYEVGESEEEEDQSGSESEGSEEEEESEDDDDARLSALKDELAEIPFDQLAKFKKQVGVKAVRSLKSATPQEQAPKGKNRPVEVSSKRRVKILRQVMEGTANKSRDPRFSGLHGHFNEDLFEKSYSFLNEYREKEIQTLKEGLKKEKNAERKSEMANQLSKLSHQDSVVKKTMEKKKIKSERLKNERELVKKGKNPFYLKKSDEKKLELVKKYEELKKKGRLDTYMEKRRKKNANKEHKFIPRSRRDE